MTGGREEGGAQAGDHRCSLLGSQSCGVQPTLQPTGLSEASEETQNSLLEKTAGIRNSGSNTDLLHGFR